LNIRPALATDIPALVEIGHKFFALNPFRHKTSIDEDSLAASLAGFIKDHVVLMAEIDGKVIGTAGAVIVPLYWNDNYFQGLETFWWLDPEHRGNGNGKALRAALEASAKEEGADFWVMMALEDSEPEKVGEMYKKAGLVPIEHSYMKAL
jgi:L-amino acid N-acyltransferase YncA